MMNKATSSKVSVLVPVYGVEPFIEKCARSLFGQTFENIEYVFVNDCTPDKSIFILEKVLQEYPERKKQTKIIHHQQNEGISQTRNTLIENASGQYVVFIDSDDWVELSMIEKTYSKAVNEQADIVGYDYYLSYPDDEVYQHTDYSSDHFTNFKNIVSLQINAFTCMVLVKKELYTQNNISFIPGINVGEDYIINVKLFYNAKKVASISEPLYHYVQYNPTNYSRLSLQNIIDRINAVSEVEKFCREKNILYQVQQEIDGRKLIIKNPFLFSDEYLDYQRWKTTFPEANYAWRQFNFRTDYKLIYWLAEHHAFGLVDWVKSFKRVFRK